ncbi:undecaprenyldiphospho-muramoylpentapeptide beta-N-acetylglucosaminyltransferase [Brevibacillus sp. SYSU BS000544]|uniref:undecaprenyldiphospho-muramoylpentapeptide beta-N-acetylglucosaminyltransferase n=1 Tax=Brevibacillus sp. SYSU BS000544 TaxID=3416443 RepID=UPI003CE519BD
MRVVLTGGGTGGHIYPALAVAEEILRHEPQAKFLYIGTSKGLESKLVPKQGLPFEEIEISGIQRKLTLENVRTAWKFIRSVSKSKEILRKWKPDIVIGTGGYVCGPVVFAAARLGIPTLIHEQNVVPGLTNVFLSRFVDRIAVSFEESLTHFPKQKTVYTGNPRATQVQHGNADAGREMVGVSPEKPIVLVVGGSRGARAINEATLQLVPYIKQHPDYHFVYVTGDVHYDKIAAQLSDHGNLPANLSLLPFVHQMPDLLAATHLIVNRAGASFLAEITSLGIPAVLIPSPYVTNNHQEKNARGLERVGAAVVILEKELNGESLQNALDPILTNQELRERMRQESLKMGKKDAASSIYHEVEELMKRK